MTELKHSFISIDGSYGGNQMRSGKENMRVCGCGVISSADLLIYLARFHSACSPSPIPDALREDIISLQDYDAFCLRLSHAYLPLIPRHGINGLALVAGLNAYFLRHAMPFRASWGARRRELFPRIEELLSRDIPVILSIGPNFPRFWEKERTSLYVRYPDGASRPASSVKSHFVTVTGIDGDWLRVSSWGKQYFISRAEYERYTREHSSAVLCSIVNIRQK